MQVTAIEVCFVPHIHWFKELPSLIFYIQITYSLSKYISGKLKGLPTASAKRPQLHSYIWMRQNEHVTVEPSFSLLCKEDFHVERHIKFVLCLVKTIEFGFTSVVHLWWFWWAVETANDTKSLTMMHIYLWCSSKSLWETYCYDSSSGKPVANFVCLFLSFLKI